MGRIVPELGDATLRELIFQSYRIVYSIENGGREIVVLGVVHGALDFDRTAQESSWHLL